MAIALPPPWTQGGAGHFQKLAFAGGWRNLDFQGGADLSGGGWFFRGGASSPSQFSNIRYYILENFRLRRAFYIFAHKYCIKISPVAGF